MERRLAFGAVGIAVAALLLRATLAYINAPNNAFDDHLEVIAHYAGSWERPHPSQCWECYQPPLYYVVAAITHRLAHAVSDSLWVGWRAVQALNVLASVAHLAIIWRLLSIVGARPPLPRLFAFACIAFLPRDVYTAAILTNDGFLALLAGFATLLFAKTALAPTARSQLASLFCLSVAITLAAWTKQSGLALSALAVLALTSLYSPATTSRETLRASQRWSALAIVLAGFAAAFLDEGIRWTQTGTLLASNQDYFDWALTQDPGDLSRIQFFDLRILSLLQAPTISDTTVASYWTEIFARFWYDYEPKLLPITPAAHAIAAVSYVTGLSIVAIWTVGLIRAREFLKNASLRLGLYFIQFSFLAVPLLQTIRFPYFSSMKAMFVLPALAASAVFLSFGFAALCRRAGGQFIATSIVVVLTCATALHIWLAGLGIHERLEQGPIWPFPPFP